VQDNAIEKFADNLADRLADEAVETTLSESCFRRVKAAEIIVAELAVLSGEKMDVESTAKKIARKLFGPARRLVLEPKGVSFQGRGWCEQAVLDVIEAELDIATTPPGWVTIGRIKVDLETETETFERAKPKQPLPEPDDPQPPAAPGDADLSPEQVAAALNARKWRGREDWMAHSVVRPGSAFVESKGRLGHNEALTYWPLDDAAALVQGWKAQDELAVQRMNTDSDRAYIASLEASVSALTAEKRATEGEGQMIATTHNIERTAPKGGPFIGTCRLCGMPGLTSGQANEFCGNPNSATNEDSLMKAITGEDE
jgi:hypothetical protein